MTFCLIPMLAVLNGLDCTPQPAYASRYAPGIMLATVEARQEWGHLPNDLSRFDGFVAVGDCDRVGETIILRDASKPNQPWLRMAVADCAGDEHAAAFMEHIAVEVDHNTAQSWGFDCLCGWPIETMEVTR